MRVYFDAELISRTLARMSNGKVLKEEFMAASTAAEVNALFEKGGIPHETGMTVLMMFSRGEDIDDMTQVHLDPTSDFSFKMN